MISWNKTSKDEENKSLVINSKRSIEGQPKGHMIPHFRARAMKDEFLPILNLFNLNHKTTWKRKLMMRRAFSTKLTTNITCILHRIKCKKWLNARTRLPNGSFNTFKPAEIKLIKSIKVLTSMRKTSIH